MQELTSAILKSTKGLLVVIEKPEDIALVEERLFAIGAGYPGATLNELSQSLSGQVDSIQAIICRPTGKMGWLTQPDDFEMYPSFTKISVTELLTSSISDFKERVVTYRQSIEDTAEIRQIISKLNKQSDKIQATPKLLALFRELNKALVNQG